MSENDSQGDLTRAISELSILLDSLVWQDSLLQAYRNYLLVTQSIFLAVAAGLLASQASMPTWQSKLTYFLPLVALLLLASVTSVVLGRALRERAKCVDWWQSRLLTLEARAGACHHFTGFLLAKSRDFQLPEIGTEQLNAEQLHSLINIRRPRARKAFEIFVPGFRILWALVLVGALLDLVAKLRVL